MTAAGRVALRRRSLRCPACGAAAYPADDRVGLDGFLSPRATRLACLVAAGWLLRDRRGSPGGTGRHPARRRDDPPPRPPGRRGPGRPPRGRPAEGGLRRGRGRGRVPRRWRHGPDPRRLARAEAGPLPEAAGGRAGRAGGLGDPRAARPDGDGGLRAVADCEAFSARWGPRAPALGIDPAGPLTVLGDGAEWIWSAGGGQFPAAAQVLDIFHASQHLAAAAAALHGEGTARRPSGPTGAAGRCWPTAGRGCWTTSAPRRRRAGRRPARRPSTG